MQPVSRHAQIICDLTKGLPFVPSESIDAVFSEAFLEHLTRADALVLLKECHRALRPGGRLRIAIPGLADLIRIYLEAEKHPEAESAIRASMGDVWRTPCELFNYAMRDCEPDTHKHIYDREEIDLLFMAAGFVDIAAAAWGQSDFPLLRDRETRPHGMTLITEGRKPG